MFSPFQAVPRTFSYFQKNPFREKMRRMIIFIMFVSNQSLNHDTQMIIPFNISEKQSLKSWFMEKLSNIVLLQTLIAFWKTNWEYWSFANHDLKMDLIHTWWMFFIILNILTKIQNNHHLLSQRAIKVWIIAYCIDFMI
jgi:hypothetical protein